MSAKPVRWIAAIILSVLLVNLASGRSSSAPIQARVYTIVAAQSTFTVLVGKAGLFSGLGHDHTIVVKSFSGRVQVPAAGVAQASLELEAEAKSLAVAD